jgi:GT2 family glycosyltransferase
VAPPELAVVVPSHFRPLRLRWLLEALAEQTLDRRLWEVVVGHDSGQETERLLREHPLAAAGVLRHAQLPESSGSAASHRNAALALVRAPVVVFTDDDCRPPPEWLQVVLAAARRRPGAVIQGPVRSDPEEAVRLRATYPRTQHFDDVPRVWAECANIVYPTALVRRLGGFAEDLWIGEDTDLCLRARGAGARYVGDRSIATRHAVEEGRLLDWIRAAPRWADEPRLVARHPGLREHLFARVFWKDSHGWLPVALIGLALARRRPLALALVVPWVRTRPFRGGGLRGRLRHLAELPGYALIDLAETAVLARASVRHRTVVL